MSTIYILFMIFFTTPALAATAFRIAAANSYIHENGELNLSSEVNKSHLFLSIVIIICLYLILTLLGYNFLDNTSDVTITTFPFAILTIASIALFISVFRALQFYKRAELFFNIATAYITLWVTWYAGSLAGQLVSESTGISASEFPSAVLGFTLLLAPVLWAVVAALVFLACYLITGLAIMGTPALKDLPQDSIHRKNLKFKYFIFLSLLLGLAFTPSITLKLAETALKSEWTESRLSEILIFSGYPLKKHKCVTGKSDNDRFSILTSQKIAVAEYISEYEYKFFTVECPKEETK